MPGEPNHNPGRCRALFDTFAKLVGLMGPVSEGHPGFPCGSGDLAYGWLMTAQPHPDIAGLAFLVGTWRGSGHGVYPTIEDFDYLEEITILPGPKPFLVYTQRTRSPTTGEPMHSESGYFRLLDGSPELVLAQPTGIVEVHRGTLEGTSVRLGTTDVGATPSAVHHRVTEVTRHMTVEADQLRYQLSMAAVGQPLQVHLDAVLHRVAEE